MIYHKDTQTIVAQATPQGSGALAVLRVSGAEAIVLVDGISRLASKKCLSEVPSHTVHVGYILGNDGQIIDQVMFALMRAPKTFTGEDVVEITCHNNQFIIENIIARIIASGARYAQHGEFSKRAFLNGKIDLVQAEAINECIGATNQYALKASLAQMKGSFSSCLHEIEQRLMHCYALCEASFEFLDDEAISFDEQIGQAIEQVGAELTSLIATQPQQIHMRQGIKIALIGSVNAGKSSLFNALIKQERAIVTDIPGTTRDAIEALISYEGMYWTLVDTAGLRTTHDIIEQEGIKRSYKQAQEADIIVLVYDQSRAMTSQEKDIYCDLHTSFGNKIVVVANKHDLPHVQASPFNSETTVLTSFHDQESIALLMHILQEKVVKLFTASESPFLLNQRHFRLLQSMNDKITVIKKMVTKKPIAYELLSVHLQDALEDISQLTGKSISEQMMDAVFKEFCVGK